MPKRHGFSISEYTHGKLQHYYFGAVELMLLEILSTCLKAKERWLVVTEILRATDAHLNYNGSPVPDVQVLAEDGESPQTLSYPDYSIIDNAVYNIQRKLVRSTALLRHNLAHYNIQLVDWTNQVDWKTTSFTNLRLDLIEFFNLRSNRISLSDCHRNDWKLLNHQDSLQIWSPNLLDMNPSPTSPFFASIHSKAAGNR